MVCAFECLLANLFFGLGWVWWVCRLFLLCLRFGYVVGLRVIALVVGCYGMVFDHVWCLCELVLGAILDVGLRVFVVFVVLC